MIRPGMLINNRYEVIEKVGTGGMSVVYKAKCIVLQRYVAIKVLREEYCLDDEFVRKFKVEAQSAASLSHNNIVKIYDVGNDGNIHFIVMEFLEGITLKDYIKEKGIIDNRETMKIGACIASALDHAHDNHIIHRDIKPQNIMILSDGNIKVMDFGIARIATESTIVAGDLAAGSVHYIAPEQARGAHSDEKNDIYSLGITMYEMVTGQLPFTADSAVSVALKHINEDLPSIVTYNPDVSKALEQIIIKATLKKTEERYQSAEEVLKDLKKAANFPNSEFIDLSTHSSNSPTIIITESEMKEISEGVKEKEDEPKKEKKRFDVLAMILGVLAAVIVTGILSMFLIDYLNEKVLPVEVEVPLVKDMPIENAKTLLDNLGIAYNVVREEYNTEVEKGHVVSQNQEGLLVLEPEESVIVDLVVSKGEELFEVPNVLNLDFNQGKLKIANANLKVVDQLEHNDLVPVGQIYKQDPQPGEKVSKDTQVTIYISNGPEKVMVKMPAVKNLTEANGINKLTTAGLKVGNITYIVNEDIEKGKIITANVEEGAEVAEGYVVNLVVSEGKPLVEKIITVFDILPVDQDSGQIKIEYINEEEVVEVIFDELVTRNQFPLNIKAKGRGVGVIKIYIDGARGYTDAINFDEVSN